MDETIKVVLKKEVAKALELTKALPFFSENPVESMMAVQNNPQQYWDSHSHLLNELPSNILRSALVDGYNVA